MNILILNWRDIKNPKGGGAEILTHEMAKYWHKKGNNVMQISAKYKGCLDSEVIDGISINRIGSWWNIHILAFFYYIFRLRGKTDIIIDEVHGIPFFSVIYARKKTILLACEVARGLFFKVFPYPIALLGKNLENLYLKIYKNTPCMAISPSTKDDLIKNQFNPNIIKILPMGLNIPKGARKYKKEKDPTLIYLSRINKQKGIEDAVSAFALVKKEFKNSKLWIVGSGEFSYLNYIKMKIRELKLSKDISFFGFVNQREKFKLLSKAHVLIFPSIHEGWGLVIAEAGVVGTPAAVYNIPGARDVVKKGKRGLISEKGDVNGLSKNIIKILKDKNAYSSLLKNLESYQKEIGWDRTGKESLKFIYKYVIEKK